MKRLLWISALLALALLLPARAEEAEARLGHIGIAVSPEWNVFLSENGDKTVVNGFTDGGAFSLSATTDAALDFFSKEALCGRALSLSASLTGGVVGEIGDVYRVADESLGFDYAHVSVLFPSETALAYAECAFSRFGDGEIGQYAVFFSSEKGLEAVRALNGCVSYYAASQISLAAVSGPETGTDGQALSVGSFAIGERTLATDTANRISADSLASLNALANRLSRETGADIAFAVLTGEPGEDIQAVAEAYYAESGMGEDGLLLMMHMSDSRWLLKAHGSVSERFNAESRDALADLFLGKLANGDFSAAMEAYINGAADFLR